MTHAVLRSAPASARPTSTATPPPAAPPADITAGREPRTTEEVFTS